MSDFSFHRLSAINKGTALNEAQHPIIGPLARINAIVGTGERTTGASTQQNIQPSFQWLSRS